MTKFVVSNSQVAHLWANQSQEHARSGSMSFRGSKCYSYSTCIAAYYPTLGARGVVLLNSRKYSATTSSRHMPAVERALHGLGRTVISVPEVCGVIDYPNDMARAHSINQSYLSAQYKDYAAKLMRVQSLSDWHREDLLGLREATLTYARAFGLVEPEHHAANDWSEALARRTRLDNDPKRREKIAARERAREAREARDRLAAELRNVEVLAGFRAGAAQGYWHLVDRDGAAYLRLSLDGMTVQTSRGADVPAADARRAIQFISLVKQRGQSWTRNGETCPVGRFQVDRISPNGDIHAGCHFIKWEEIQPIGATLGVY